MFLFSCMPFFALSRSCISLDALSEYVELNATTFLG